MVKLEEIQDESIRRQAAAAQDDEDDWENESDASSVSSDEGDDDDKYASKERSLSIPRESIFQRISALKDIIPPSTRRSLTHSVRTVWAYGTLGTRIIGNIGWVVVTSALLVGLPYALAVENEQLIVQQEREFASQQSGQQMLGGGMPGQPGQPGQPQQQQQQEQGGIRPPGF